MTDEGIVRKTDGRIRTFGIDVSRNEINGYSREKAAAPFKRRGG